MKTNTAAARARRVWCLVVGPAGRAWADQLFYVAPEGKVLHLGSEMSIVAIGDYDGDGQSELLAKFERPNNDGYALFFDGFERSVSFGWTYH